MKIEKNDFFSLALCHIEYCKTRISHHRLQETNTLAYFETINFKN